MQDTQDTVDVTITLDRWIKEDAEKLFENLGMSLSTAIDSFVREVLRQGKIPFEIFDPFYSDRNQAELRRRIADVEAGGNLTIHELEVEDEDE
ncbi:MAG: type II toxin-antitoxin system antitoxin, RelB/DinJ family [Clostridiales bacterium]|nr:type II toxin-antitoxin system antitoxin, RelB/DinJ family [Clostridiales bacterium]